jgi:hypothetical protein
VIKGYFETEKLLFLSSIDQESILTEDHDFFEGVIYIFILLNERDGLTNFGIIVAFRLNKFIQIESINISSLIHIGK